MRCQPTAAGRALQLRFVVVDPLPPVPRSSFVFRLCLSTRHMLPPRACFDSALRARFDFAASPCCPSPIDTTRCKLSKSVRMKGGCRVGQA